MANFLSMADITRIRTLAQAGWSQRRIARELGHDRGTIQKYLRDEELPDPPAPSPSRQSKCEPYRASIEALLEKGLTADRIHRELRDEHGFAHSYQSVVRFVRKLKATEPKRVWRMECEPGEEAQVDFGVARTLRTADGKLRFSNVLRVTLSHSRKGYTETLAAPKHRVFHPRPGECVPPLRRGARHSAHRQPEGRGAQGRLV